MCECAYCKEGMSETIEDYMDKRIEVTKRLREGLKGVDFKDMFRRMYGLKEVTDAN